MPTLPANASRDIASQCSAGNRQQRANGPAVYAYSDNDLIDTDHGIIFDVNTSRSNKTAQVGAMRKMLGRTEE